MKWIALKTVGIHIWGCQSYVYLDMGQIWLSNWNMQVCSLSGARERIAYKDLSCPLPPFADTNKLRHCLCYAVVSNSLAQLSRVGTFRLYRYNFLTFLGGGSRSIWKNSAKYLSCHWNPCRVAWQWTTSVCPGNVSSSFFWLVSNIIYVIIKLEIWCYLVQYCSDKEKCHGCLFSSVTRANFTAFSRKVTVRLLTFCKYKFLTSVCRLGAPEINRKDLINSPRSCVWQKV